MDDGHVHRSALVCAAAGQEPGVGDARDAWPVWWSTPKGCSATVRRGAAVLCSPIRGTGPGALDAASEAAALSRSVAWFAGSAAQGWCVPLTAGAQRTLGMEPFRDLSC